MLDFRRKPDAGSLPPWKHPDSEPPEPPVERDPFSGDDAEGTPEDRE